MGGFIADNLDVDVDSLLRRLGLGGLAFALAAKDVAGNLFDPRRCCWTPDLHVGDWLIGDVEGTVERIGFRSTRIRTFYNSLVTVPNLTLITANVDNMGARSRGVWSLQSSVSLLHTRPTASKLFVRAASWSVNIPTCAKTISMSTSTGWETFCRRSRFTHGRRRTGARNCANGTVFCSTVCARPSDSVSNMLSTQTLYMREAEETPPPVADDEFVAAVSAAMPRARGRPRGPGDRRRDARHRRCAGAGRCRERRQRTANKCERYCAQIEYFKQGTD